MPKMYIGIKRRSWVTKVASYGNKAWYLVKFSVGKFLVAAVTSVLGLIIIGVIRWSIIVIRRIGWVRWVGRVGRVDWFVIVVRVRVTIVIAAIIVVMTSLSRSQIRGGGNGSAVTMTSVMSTTVVICGRIVSILMTARIAVSVLLVIVILSSVMSVTILRAGQVGRIDSSCQCDDEENQEDLDHNQFKTILFHV